MVDLGLRKGRDKFLNFSDDPIPEKEMVLYFLLQMPNPLRWTMLAACI